MTRVRLCSRSVCHDGAGQLHHAGVRPRDREPLRRGGKEEAHLVRARRSRLICSRSQTLHSGLASELPKHNELFPDNENEVFIQHFVVCIGAPSRFRDQVAFTFRKLTLDESAESVDKVKQSHSMQAHARHEVYGLETQQLDDIEVQTAAAVFCGKKSWYLQFTKVHQFSLSGTLKSPPQVLYEGEPWLLCAMFKLISRFFVVLSSLEIMLRC